MEMEIVGTVFLIHSSDVFVCSPNSYIEALIANVIVFRIGFWEVIR